MTFFDFSSFSLRGGSNQKKYLDHSSKHVIFWLVELSHLSSFIIFTFYSTNLNHGQGNSPFSKYNRSKLSTPILNKPVLLSSAAHTSSESNSTGTSILSQLDNKDITTNQNNNNTSNTHDIHWCVSPPKKTVFRPHLRPLIWCHLTLHFILHLFSYTQKVNYPSLVKYISILWLTKK